MLLLGGMGVRLARAERQQAEQRFHEVVAAQLTEIDQRVAEYVRGLENKLLEVAGTSDDSAALRAAFTGTGLVREYFAVSPEGELLFPNASSPGSDAFFRRTEVIWQNSSLPFAFPEKTRQQTDLPTKASKTTDRAAGWHTWYWGTGIQFIFWWRDARGGARGVELNGPRLLADVIGVLPDTALVNQSTGAAESGCVRLLDTQGLILYQWGGYEPSRSERPLATLPLSPPFQSWQLHAYLPSAFLPPGQGSLAIGVTLLIAAAAACFILLAVYFYRESSRELREASQRVSFVNQVSHELKTPLTNIRLYAEVLQEELPEQDPLARHAGIIAEESQRLSRLIGNILTFARKQRKQLTVHPKPEPIDEVIAASVGLHQPRLREKGIEIALDLQADEEVPLDRDAFEQVLYNLLNNAEKYASQGGRVLVRSRRQGDECLVEVCDEGPGVPHSERERVFRPFYRLRDHLSEGVSGTGLGLSLARELARLHGGDLVCVSWEGCGACFQLRLPVGPPSPLCP